jgi:hypothetical protein
MEEFLWIPPCWQTTTINADEICAKANEFIDAVAPGIRSVSTWDVPKMKSTALGLISRRIYREHPKQIKYGEAVLKRVLGVR